MPIDGRPPSSVFGRPARFVPYRVVVDRLNGYFGTMPLAAIRPRDVAAYVAQASADYAPATVVRDVSVLHAIFTSVRREELVDSKPAERAERPKASRRRLRILEPVEVARVARELTDVHNGLRS